jgi:hypothetical protein
LRLAYESDSSGQFEVYVRPFPNVGEACRRALFFRRELKRLVPMN